MMGSGSKKNPEPMVAPEPVSTAMPAGSMENVTNTTSLGDSKEDIFAKLKAKFMNELNKIPREYLVTSSSSSIPF